MNTIDTPAFEPTRKEYENLKARQIRAFWLPTLIRIHILECLLAVPCSLQQALKDIDIL